jgi:hypothetical protein
VVSPRESADSAQVQTLAPNLETFIIWFFPAKAEREAMAHLFAGAIGLFKNPSSHRNVGPVPEATAELIYFAKYLLRLVEEARQNADPPKNPTYPIFFFLRSTT